MLPYLSLQRKKSMNLKEKKRRKKFKNSEISQLFYKQLYKNGSFYIKRKISFKFAEKNKDIYKSRMVNRCLLTDRFRGVISRKFKMARYAFRISALKGLIPGVYKGSN
jgi:small subunit ribosomal protein S14